MAEKLGIDGTFRNGSAVHGKIFPVLPQTVVMDNSGKHLLTHSILPRHQHRQIDGGYFQRYFEGTIECLAIAHDAVALFDALYDRINHNG